MCDKSSPQKDDNLDEKGGHLKSNRIIFGHFLYNDKQQNHIEVHFYHVVIPVQECLLYSPRAWNPVVSLPQTAKIIQLLSQPQAVVQG